MTISRKHVAVVAIFLAAASQAVVVDAQIINASLPTSDQGVQNAAVTSEKDGKLGGFLPVSWPSVSLPKISMPKIPMPKLSMPKWPTKADGTAVSPFAPLTAGASKISSGTQKVWQGTKDMFSFGSANDVGRPAVVAASSPKPSFWQRVVGKEPEPDGPKTVAEWMAQPRVGH